MDRATFVSSDGLGRCCFSGAGKVSRCSEAVDRDCGAISGDFRVSDSKSAYLLYFADPAPQDPRLHLSAGLSRSMHAGKGSANQHCTRL